MGSRDWRRIYRNKGDAYKRREKERKIGQREQASKINFEGEKTPNNKVGSHNCKKKKQPRKETKKKKKKGGERGCGV